MSIDTGVFPDALKKASVVPIYKAGDKSIFTNYRPISILPAFSKVFEKVITNRLDSFLSKYNILFDKQFGFRKNHSTAMAILN
jgi:potassium voltage-gated channel Eag-related subfamily H protein 8